MTDRTLWTDLTEMLRAGRIPRRSFVGECVRLGFSASAAGALFAGCTRDERARESRRDRPIENQLNIYNWSDYVAERTVADFEREHGVRVVYDTYESNEEMLAKIQAGAAGYDIIVPSNYMVEILLASNLLAPLRHEWIPNLSNLGPRFRDPPYDPANAHSVVYQWGTTGIAYRSDLVHEEVSSWAILWNEAYRGKITMLDDVREVIGITLKALGYSLNSTDERALQEAKRRCIEQKRLLKAYISAPVKAQVIAGDVWLAQLWSGDTFQAQAEESAIRYSVPNEGSAIWSDSLCIARSAPHPRAAHAWIDYVLRPEVSAEISRKVRYSSPNPAARALLPEEMRSNPGMYPPEEVMDRLEWARDLGEATRLWSRIWTEIKAA